MTIKVSTYLSAIVTSSVLFAGAANAQLGALPSINGVQAPFKSEVIEEQAAEPINISGGAYASNGNAPSLYNTGRYSFLNLPVVGAVSSSAKITVVNYYYNYSYLPSGMRAYLCWNSTSTCADVTGRRSGRLEQFRNKAANKPFFFAFGVAGNGSALSPPAYGGNSQVIVNYSF
ncbi:flagellar protein FlhE [Pseudoalteromonas luteoviolacea]|uniref:Flagellar protein FlhE n=1 Tax=Pseudoalteromonas luteoviolacea H33 TaxID=1365251 RepID=A0A167GHA3_9GAMM|nr:flagellar protein FlhE [Pseudoalteromonas luteoviolacea]KZN55448.1 hypothetical protein N476_06890 [Pseudoalteromonas luteoviolacea H33]KZN74533.1 hypothetical protein N477_22410 [Pseudoalteromonas luteoviolacea H33-S]MBQ4878990.1 flagellar protein FlhE [Pseudoalteromonas luteoviolacea]MBQ4908059.1 flagellar protein FlhE [Pseudoalteromonas luteoviolacea]